MTSLAWTAAVLLSIASVNVPAGATDAGASTRTAPLVEPDAAQALPPKAETRGEARIEQRRQGARVIEIVVTPAGRTYSYSMQNREGQRPLSPQDLGSGLSTPRFLRLEF